MRTQAWDDTMCSLTARTVFGILTQSNTHPYPKPDGSDDTGFISDLRHGRHIIHVDLRSYKDSIFGHSLCVWILNGDAAIIHSNHDCRFGDAFDVRVEKRMLQESVCQWLSDVVCASKLETIREQEATFFTLFGLRLSKVTYCAMAHKAL